MAQDTTDIVALEHLEAIADHARLQDSIGICIDRVFHHQALQSSKLHHAAAQHDIHVFVCFRRRCQQRLEDLAVECQALHFRHRFDSCRTFGAT